MAQTTHNPMDQNETPQKHNFVQLARDHWLKAPSKKPAKVKVKPDVLRTEIWDVLEAEDFQFQSLQLLENVQLLESYLWPGYSEESSNIHVLLITLITNVKIREQVRTWDIFSSNPPEFSSLFQRILSLTLDTTLCATIRIHLLSFVISAFQSLDNGIVRKECAPLVSISIWHNLSSEKVRESKLGQTVQLQKAWRAAAKRHDAADEAEQTRLKFQREWLHTLTVDFLNQAYRPRRKPADVLYCERFLEFLSDLESQLPTRRYVNALLLDIQVLPALVLSPIYNDEENSLFRDLYNLLKHYVYFSIDDHSGVQYSQTGAYDRHCNTLAILQRTALRHFKEKLTILALSNYASIDKRDELEGYLAVLTDQELGELCSILNFRTSYPSSCGVPTGRKFLLEILLFAHERRKTFQESSRDLSILPNEQILFQPSLLRNETYNGSRPLALPKLNLQYLTIGDFLWRSFILHRAESFYEIRKDLEEAVKRMKPKLNAKGVISFQGFSRMALPIALKPAILEVVPPSVGSDKPSIVRAEISLDVTRLANDILREWETLRQDDVVFLVSVKPPGIASNKTATRSEAEKHGLVTIRAAEVTQVLDERGHSIREQQMTGRSHGRGHVRKLQLKLDTAMYKEDLARTSSGKTDVYGSINMVVRRRGRENNFKPILESIQSLTLSEVPLAPWLHEVFLGYGNPAGATWTKMGKAIKTVDYRDTFLDWQHLIESFPGKIVEPSDDVDGSFGPPYVLEMSKPAAGAPPAKPSKKRRRGQPEPEVPQQSAPESISVSSYKPRNTGPYPVGAPKLNQVRFTPAQVEAIISGTQPGLTVIVGPPGTGKTDVATQIINNIYHNFPEQRTLLIAHSNQALNQLFQKIVALDIDERHLLRLGHGEEELDTESDFSKFGRVESFMENRNRLLMEVNRLAVCLGAPGSHGNDAETAGYFCSVYVEPAWKRFQEALSSENMPLESLIEAFPFHGYFSNAPQPPIPQDASRDVVVDIFNGCYHHISKIFTELADVRPFEILRREKDKANYLLTNEARIIAMTSTHAAMRRRDIADLGFHYDNVVIEEAAQITEIENFMPLAMQKPQNLGKKGREGLRRVVLCGDHLQNSPVIQNLAFRQYANLEQSLFSRLIRLGVPTINLDMQGRARPSIAELYSWRYPKLGNLSHVLPGQGLEEFSKANAGFKYEYQFIAVPDYKGKGEMEPTPHFIQNLGEAEYAVAIFQYMRLLGYPRAKISILATYAGQRALIKDVLTHRCAKNPLFGLPKMVTTVDKYQGEQNDYIILSLTRTSRPGYLRDIRRLTVALSRARLGLYILGRREVFENCYELKSAFEILLQRPDKLMLVTRELFPAARASSDKEEVIEGSAAKSKGKKGGKSKKSKGKGVEEEFKEDNDGVVPGEFAMEGVEHLGQYVYEMTQTRMKQLQEENGLPAIAEGEEIEMKMDDVVAVEDEEAMDYGDDVDDAVNSEEEEGLNKDTEMPDPE